VGRGPQARRGTGKARPRGNRVHVLDVAARTDPGLVREHNEDAYLADEEVGVFVVADGMGGHRAGELASRIAAETIVDDIRERWHCGGLADEILLEALATAHQKIIASAQADPSRRGMGTTAVVAWIPLPADTAWVAHVGDSRGYLLRDGHLEGLTEDHTLLNQIARAGRLSPDPAEWPSRHALSQSLGAASMIAPEVRAVPLRDGDLVLLCSDGLTDGVEDTEIARVLGTGAQPELLAERLVEAARTLGGGRDNITVVVIAVDGLRRTLSQKGNLS
jgi:serine/threonine protein phosphatase PrpC